MFFVLVCFLAGGWPVFGVTMSAFDGGEIEGWFGLNSDFSIITQSDLDKILEEHRKWLKSDKKDGKKANLEGANLERASLKGAKLERANLQDADLREANLQDADLRETNLQDAYLWKANLQDADLREANLQDAYLWKANLQEANLVNANLQRTVLELKPKKNPNIQLFAWAKNLYSLTYMNSPHSLIEVRKALKEAGFRKNERELTYAIHHNRILKEANILEAFFCFCFFDFTCGWGMNFFRPIIIMFSLIFVFSHFYKKILLKEKKKDGIWKIWLEGRVRKDLGGKKPELLRLKKTSFEYRRFFGLNIKWIKNWDVIKLSLYFSLLSAFHIGWRDFNVGSWITKIQPQEYALRATGKARVISGIQSLISVYLLALSILTYFGRPFD